MSTLAKRIEKEYILNALYVEQVPVSCYVGREEYVMFAKTITRDVMILSVDRPFTGIRPEKKICLLFSYRDHLMVFDVHVLDIRGGEIICEVPAHIRKNLDRSHLRVVPPRNVEIAVSFFSDRYNLPLPRLRKYHHASGEVAEFPRLREEVKKFVEDGDYEYRMALFGDADITGSEERALAYTGKILFMDDTAKGFPAEDTADGLLLTQEGFRRYLFEDSGIDGFAADEAVARFLREKAQSDVVSDLWVPLILQEYVFGCIRIASRKAGTPPLNRAAVEKIYRYAEIMSQILEEKGRLPGTKIPCGDFPGEVWDIGVSGLLFSCTSPEISLKFMPGCDLRVKITLPDLQYFPDIRAEIVRVTRGQPETQAGCLFKDVSAADAELLSKYIYAGSPVAAANH